MSPWTEQDYQQHMAKIQKAKSVARNRTARGTSAVRSTRKSPKGAFDPFLALCVAHGLPAPRLEWPFHETRGWKFDYAWPSPFMVALEQEGGAFTNGRHTRGQGFIDDMEKYNQAVLLGWKLLRFTPQQLASGECLPLLRILLGC